MLSKLSTSSLASTSSRGREPNVILFSRKCGHSVRKKLNEVTATRVDCGRKYSKTFSCGHSRVISCEEKLAEDTLVCQQTIKKQFSYCEHTLDTRCGDPGPYFCDVEVQHPFECDHVKAYNCHGGVRVCEEICGRLLRCGHHCPEVCHAGPHPSCKNPCTKKCVNGHGCPVEGRHHCGDTGSCPPCPVAPPNPNGQPKCFTCKAVLKRRCQDDFLVEICPSHCLKTCNRGHPCQRRCGDQCQQCEILVVKKNPLCLHPITAPCFEELDYATPCAVLVKPSHKPECDHPNDIEVPCRKRKAKVEDLMQFCRVKCKDVLACGHPCTGSCLECKQGRFHTRCVAPCDRTLLCGHICSSPCNKDCPPCPAPCESRCEHRKCYKICGLPCKDCEEDCQYKCDCLNSKCSRKCNEPCERICEKPCRRIIRCGHECIGYCGDVCPELCRICDNDKLQDGIFTGEPLDDSHRFIQLDNCTHVIERESLDGYMKSKSTENEISSICCLLCRRPILNIRRYFSILKMNRDDKNKVAAMVYGTDEENKESLMELENDLCDALTMLVPTYGNTLDFLLEDILRWKDTNKVIINSHKAFFNVWAACERKHADLKPILSEYKLQHLYSKSFHFLKMLAARRLPYTTGEKADLEREILRFNDFLELIHRVRMDIPDMEKMIKQEAVILAYHRAIGQLNLHTRYTEEVETRFLRLLKILEAKTNHSVKSLADEKRMIVESFVLTGVARGRWFKCPNGHPYIITECGGAQVVGYCNECGAQIGGEDHVVLYTNTLDHEMAETLEDVLLHRPTEPNLRQVVAEHEPAERLLTPILFK